MHVYAVDLGTSNTKVVLYDEALRRLAQSHAPTPNVRRGVEVEFDPADTFRLVLRLVHECAAAVGDTARHHAVIVVTGQAESVVLVDADGDAVRPGLSWLDERAVVQAGEIADRFPAEVAFAVTGQPASTATWPAAKLRWLAQHEPAALQACTTVLMVKDDLLRRLTAQEVGEATTRGFTYLYDVGRRDHWTEVVEFCGIGTDKLPTVVAAGTDLGPVRDDVRDLLPPAASWNVNTGALDHFCSMVGTDSYRPGIVSESSGTVLSLSVLAQDWSFDATRRVSFHNGLRAGEVVLFNGADSGGVVLEWFRREGLAGMEHATLERGLQNRASQEAPLFLPHLTGVNPPDYLPRARGAFIDLELRHDRFDLAFAVEEGIAHLLRRNAEHLTTDLQGLVSTGGGSASPFWNQLKADVCGTVVDVPHELEATCRGAAVLALVQAGVLDDLDQGSALSPPGRTRYVPRPRETSGPRYRRFEDALLRLYRD